MCVCVIERGSFRVEAGRDASLSSASVSCLCPPSVDEQIPDSISQQGMVIVSADCTHEKRQQQSASWGTLNGFRPN